VLSCNGQSPGRKIGHRWHPNAGGAILAHGETLAAPGQRVNADPFVAEGIAR